MSAVIDLQKDLGLEPDPDRGVPLENPIKFDEPSEPKAEESGDLEADAGRQQGEGEAPGKAEDEAGKPEIDDREGTSDDDGDSTLGERFELASFVEQAGWEPSEIYDSATMKTALGELTLTDVKNNLDRLHAENETLQQERQQLEAKATQTQQPMQQYAPRAVELMNEVQQLQTNYDTASQDGTFDKMEPSESLALRMRYKDAIDQRVRAAQKVQGEYEVQYKQWEQEYKAKVDAEIREKIPAFGNKKVRTEQTGAMKDMLRSEYGVDEGRWNGMQMDPLSMKLIHDLWTLKTKQAEVKKGVKQVQKVPKSLKPGPSSGKASVASIKDVGKKLSSAKTRRDQDKILFETEFDDSLL